MEVTESLRIVDFSQAIRNSTLKRLKLFNIENVNWRPKPISMSPFEIAYHLIECDNWLIKKIEDPSIKPIKGLSKQKIVIEIEQFHDAINELKHTSNQKKKFISYLDEKDLKRLLYDDRYKKEISIWWLIMRGNLDHEIHHRGQLVVYLNLLELS